MSPRPAAGQEDIGKLVLRLAVAGILLFHGVFKLTHGVEWIKQPLGAVDLPGVMAYGAYIAEVGAPILIIAGVLTRVSALVVALDMLMAILLVLRPQVFTVRQSGGGWAIELEALILLSALALAFIGPGRYRLGGGGGGRGKP